MPDSASPTPSPLGGPSPALRRTDPASQIHLEREIATLQARLVREAHTAVGMIESACDALFKLDEPGARAVMASEDAVDVEEVHIEEEAFRILALYHPFARDFRTITAFIRMNADLERIADHATSLAKQTIKLKALGASRFPTALVELGQRVPVECHALLSSLSTQDVEGARGVIMRDKTIDRLDKRLFDECLDQMGDSRESRAAGLLMYRCGRELERVGDLAGSIAEDVIYIASGEIVRHVEKKRLKAQRGGNP